VKGSKKIEAKSGGPEGSENHVTYLELNKIVAVLKVPMRYPLVFLLNVRWRKVKLMKLHAQ
jgi:hypothetical protein